MKKNKKYGFTLVELIVVITIVGILSTVGFVSYSNYLTGARDSNRISQLVKIGDSLQVHASKKSLPLPNNYVVINASGSLIGYQGEAGVDVLETIDYSNGGKDPKDGNYYSYYLTKGRKNFQLMAMMEEQTSVAGLSIGYAADYTNRYPRVYGKKLGILTQLNTNTPIQDLPLYDISPFDIVTASGQFISHISNTEKLTGTGLTLMAMNPNSSCDRIKQTGGANGSGNYTISPNGTTEIVVYCDFENTGTGPSGQYAFPSQTVAHGSTQAVVRSTYYQIVNNFPGFTWGVDIPFTTSGQGNPTVSNSNGARSSSGNLRDGANIEINTPPHGQTYTAKILIPGGELSFAVTRESPPVATLDLNFGTKTVNYSGRIVSDYKNFPTLTTPTPISLSDVGNPTAQLSNGSRGSSGNIAYGTNIEADAPAVGQTRVIQVTVSGETGTFTIIRQ